MSTIAICDVDGDVITVGILSHCLFVTVVQCASDPDSDAASVMLTDEQADELIAVLIEARASLDRPTPDLADVAPNAGSAS